MENLYRVYYNDFILFGFSPESVLKFHEAAKGPEPPIEAQKLAKEKLQQYSNNMKSLNRMEDYEMCVKNPRWKNNRDALFHALFYKECTEECLDCNCELIKT